MKSSQPDYLIIGAGIVGLAIALELKSRHRGAGVMVLEKEAELGRHASGRNSGVLHSGIYYAPGSLKARICAAGCREMALFCEAHDLPLLRLGKIILPVRPEDGSQLDLLYDRGRLNGVHVERLDEDRLREVEPEARSATGEALLVSQTSVGSPLAVIRALAKQAERAGVRIVYEAQFRRRDTGTQEIVWRGGRAACGHLINAAGLQADLVAHQFGVGMDYTLIPFKGSYWRLDPASGIVVRHLLYPVPDLRVPFLGVHTTTSTNGDVYLGPSAFPVFGRENYSGLASITPAEFTRIAAQLLRLFVSGRDGFRRLAWQEGRRCLKSGFAAAARAILPALRTEHLLPCAKRGIRAQLLNRHTGRLVNDFVVEKGPASTHILNAISPAWTCAFPFARHVVDNFIEKAS